MRYLAVALVPLAGCIFVPRQSAQTPGAVAQPPPQYSDPRFDHSPAEADEFVAKQTEGYEAAGPPVQGRLETFSPWTVQLERGYCYRMVMRFGPDTAFSEHARRGVGFVYESPGQPQINGGPGIWGPAAVASAGCPQADLIASFDVQAYFGSATDRSRIHDLGTGGYVAQLVRKPISDEELAALEADRRRQIAESEAFQREHAAREAQARAEREARWAAEREQRAQEARSPTPSPAAASGPISITIRSRCRQTVGVFYGDNPGFSSGTQSSVSSNSVSSRSFREGDMMWLTDDSRRGVSSVTISRGMREVEILESCAGFRTR
jgi:hypothetical protein